MKDFLKVGISGVRGVVGETITPQLAASFARAFGSFVGQGEVLVGRDTRPTGYMLEQAVVAGLQSVGIAVGLTGIVATPTMCHLVAERRARGAILITASHNPVQWNALKFIGQNGMFINQKLADEFFDVYHQGEFKLAPEEGIHKVRVIEDPVRTHFEKIIRYVDAACIRGRKFKVAVDCCNGVGALYSRLFLEKLGCEVVTCCDNPNGIFEREPEPLPENLSALGELVRREKCDIGFAQDPDGDRLAIVNEKGEPIGEDQTLAFAVRQVLDHHGKGPVVIHLSTSLGVQWIAEQRGCPVTRAKIGEINVSTKMMELGSVVGGEGNGGVIIPAIIYCRDSFVGMAVVLELMAMTRRTVSQLRDEIPRYSLSKEKMRVQGDVVPALLRRLRREYAGYPLNLSDGVHVTLKDSWFHVRASNTEPVMRVVGEAPTREEAVKLTASVMAQIRQWMAEK